MRLSGLDKLAVAGKIDAAEIMKGIKADGGRYNMKTVEGGTLTATMDGDKVALIGAKGTGALVEIRTSSSRTASSTSSTAC